MDFFMNDDITITKILLACKVPAGTGATVHKNRAAHGFALNMSGEKIYIFKNRVLTVKENSIIFLPEGSDYTVKTVVPGDCYAINFKTSSSEKPEPFVLQPKNKMPITDYFISTEKIFRTKNNGYMLKCKSNLYALLYALFKEYYSTYVHSKQKEQIMPALKYIHEAYSEQNFSISFLSELCGMKESYFRRVFFNACGTSPIQYINSLKLSRAKELLLQSEYTVETVSKMAGFNNTYYFCRYFKRELGVTPGEYRKELIYD